MFYLQSSDLIEWKEYVTYLRDVCSVAKVTCKSDGLYLQVKEPGLTSALIVVRPSQFTHYSLDVAEDVGYWNLDEIDKFLKEHIKLYKCCKTIPNLIIQKVPIDSSSHESAYRFTCFHELSSPSASSTSRKVTQQQITSRTKLPSTVRRSITLRSECTTRYYSEAELLLAPSNTTPFCDFYLASSPLFENNIRLLCFINTSLEIAFHPQRGLLTFTGTSNHGMMSYEFQVVKTTESYDCPSLLTTQTISSSSSSSSSIAKARRTSKKNAATTTDVQDMKGTINSPAAVQLIHSPSFNLKKEGIVRFGYVLLRPLLMLAKLICASTNMRLICCPGKPLMIALYKKQQFFGVLSTVLYPSLADLSTAVR